MSANVNDMTEDEIISQKSNNYGGYISKIIFNNGTELEVEENDIVIFVGPNNAGKSQSLKDIYELCDAKKNTVVVNDIEISIQNGDVKELLESVSKVSDCGLSKNYSGFGFNVNTYSIPDFSSEKHFGSVRPLFVAYLDTLQRLVISNPAPLTNRHEIKTSPIHYAAFNHEYRKWLSDNFKQAFDRELIPYTLNGGNIPLCIGEAVNLSGDYLDEQERQEAYAAVLDTYKQVQNQGDGIKSFTGILLYLMIDYYRTFLIDEPESFLHPPQANIMGKIIGKTLRHNQQAFISTHSEELIKGLLDVCPERVKIVRITRMEDSNSFSILDNDTFSSVWNDPLLKYSNIMKSLFHREVVLCESDSDCKMYSIIDDYVKRLEGRYSETLFIHCGGKQRMAKIAKALRSLDVSVKLVPDIDVLNDEKVFKGIIEAFDMEWDYIEPLYNVVVSNVSSSIKGVKLCDFESCIDKVLKESKGDYLSKSDIRKIQEAIRVPSKWNEIKRGGISALPGGDATERFKKMNKKLKEKGIFIVPVGELECFIKEVGGHGPEWANSVLEKYPDLHDEVYNNIKEFIKEVCV
ncbi:Predicted ATPase [Selenomonas sp. WCT3]|uniref:ATP-dependent nuclease n=1 Tax=Selenomonas sp. WCT3 TaxID=3158785 RepID=UPI0008816ABE|nr:Predicted ATPase [Selenomonas ruminantium]